MKQVRYGWNPENMIVVEVIYILFNEAVAQRCSVKKLFLEILQNSQENTCGRVFLK